MPRIAILLLVTPLLVGGRGETLGLAAGGWLGSGETCADGRPSGRPSPWEGREPVLISADSVTPIRLGEPTCLGGECGAVAMIWPIEGADGRSGVVVPRADLAGGTILRMGTTVGVDYEWALDSPLPGPPCWAADEPRPVVRTDTAHADRPGVGGTAEACSWTPTADGRYAVQSRAIAWVQPSGWQSYAFQQWRLLTSTDTGWKPTTPWFVATDQGVRGLHRPMLIWEVASGTAYDVVFIDRGGIGGGRFLWLDEVRRDEAGAWSAKGARPQLTSPRQPCD